MKVNAVVLALLLLSVALAGCSSDEDSDGDGLSNRDEKRGYRSHVFLADRVELTYYHSDPNKKDSDGDGLSDWDEIITRGLSGLPPLDPENVDTDGDGLTDCQEWYAPVGPKGCEIPDGFKEYDVEAYTTEAHIVDSDIQGGPSRYINYHLNDGAGYDDSLSVNQRSGGFFIRGDGISDHDEIFGYDIEAPDGTIRRGITTDPLLIDSDGDGLEDGEEALQFGSDPTITDTDADGCVDGRDLFPTQVDRYRIVFDSFHLKQGPMSNGSARLVFVTGVEAFTGADFFFHPENGFVFAEKGETVDLASTLVEPAARTDCTPDVVRLRPDATDPWLILQVLAFHKNDGAANHTAAAYSNNELTVLDTRSITTEEESERGVYGQVYWNPREDVYRWNLPPTPREGWVLEADEDAITAPSEGFKFDGEDGTVWFHAEVVLGDSVE